MRVVYLLFCMLFSQITWANNSDLMLLGTYENQDIQGWVMSEKLDGVRGYWDGKTLLSRQGLPLPAPTYFIAQFPPFAIDGELFSERNQFEEIASITKSFKGDNWAKLTLYVFDVPNASGNLFERLKTLEDYLKNSLLLISRLFRKFRYEIKHIYSSIYMKLKGKKVKVLCYVILILLTKENAVYKF